MRLREIYGGAARGRSLTVAGVSAVGGSLAGVLIGTIALAGASSPHSTTPTVDKPVRKHVRHHSPSPTPYVATTYFSTTPSQSASASPTPSRSKSPSPRPTTTSRAPQPTQPPATTNPTTPPPTEPPATSSPAPDGAPESPGTS